MNNLPKCYIGWPTSGFWEKQVRFNNGTPINNADAGTRPICHKTPHTLRTPCTYTPWIDDECLQTPTTCGVSGTGIGIMRGKPETH